VTEGARNGHRAAAIAGWQSAVVRTYREAYGGLPRAAWLLALLELVNRSGMMVLFFLTLYMTRQLGFSVVQAGYVMSAYGLGSMLGTYFGGRLCDRLGAYHVQKLSLATSAVLLVVLQLPRSPWLLALLALALAAVQDALHPANAAATAQLCAPELRAKGFALHRLAGNLGISIGPVVGGYLAQRDYRALFWADGLTTLAAAGLALLFLRSAGPHVDAGSGPAVPARTPWRNRGFVRLLPLVFGVGLIFAQFFTMFPLYLRSAYGLPESSVGRLIAVNTVLIVAVEMLLMHALRHRRPEGVVAVGTVLLGLGFGLMPFGAGATYAAFTVVVWTFGEMLTLPTLMSLVTLRSDPAALGEYQGLTSLGFAAASTLGPILASWLYAAAGGNSVWYACGGLGLLLGAGFAVLRAPAVVQSAPATTIVEEGSVA
jgi:predicted MFS family arabinose efflux permease